jgi:uncharacterized protein (TIGR01319 family)
MGVKALGRAEPSLAGRRPWHRGLLIDVGSTFTKALVINEQGSILGRAQAPTTIENNVLEGVEAAVGALPDGAGPPYDWALASSSAAGGLRMASVGLTASLSGRAGSLAALGAGAKIIAMEHGLLDETAVQRIDAAAPHLVLLAGGIDGGNADALLHNARMLSRVSSALGFIIAGNADAADEAAQLLDDGKRDVRVVDNVFPRVGEIAITATREAVRDLFLQHITRAKGLDNLMAVLQTDCEPTPLAVSRGLAHLPGQGDPVVFVDLGGATTDVHSYGGLRQDSRNVEVPDPEVMRTVEGDLGMRWGAPGTVAAMSETNRARIELATECDLEHEAIRRHDDPKFLPATERDRTIDRELAQAAVSIAIERHAGRVVVRHRPWGDRYQVTGKDLRSCRLMVATGGAFHHVGDPVAVVEAALAAIDDAQAPRQPGIAIDSRYVLYAVGLLARLAPELAAKLASQALVPAFTDNETGEVLTI